MWGKGSGNKTPFPPWGVEDSHGGDLLTAHTMGLQFILKKFLRIWGNIE